MGRRKNSSKKRTRVRLVVDRSGSMSSRRDATIEGFNEYLSGLKADDADFRIGADFFDTQVEEWSEQALADFPRLDRDSYIPGGMTALLDAVGRAIASLEKVVAKKDQVLVVIMTDGHENSSREYSKDAILKKIQDKRAEGWEFIFLGAGEEAWSGATMLGIPDTHTINYGALDAQDHSAAIRSVSTTSSLYASMGSSGTRAAHDGSFVDPGVKKHLEDKAKVEIQIPKGRKLVVKN